MPSPKQQARSRAGVPKKERVFWVEASSPRGDKGESTYLEDDEDLDATEILVPGLSAISPDSDRTRSTKLHASHNPSWSRFCDSAEL